MCLWLCDFDYWRDDFDWILYLLSYCRQRVPLNWVALHHCFHCRCHSYSAIIDWLSSYYLNSVDSNYWRFALNRHQIHRYIWYCWFVVENQANAFVDWLWMVLSLVYYSFVDSWAHDSNLNVDNRLYFDHMWRMDSLLTMIKWFLLEYCQAFRLLCCPSTIASASLQLNRRLVVAALVAVSFSSGFVSLFRCFGAACLND